MVSVIGMVAFLFVGLGADCRPIQTDFCATDAECDDSDDCTADECSLDSGDMRGVCVNVLTCTDEEHCVRGRCVDCLDDTECDDHDACNGMETCDEGGSCANGQAPNCDDGDACTEDRCDSQTGCVNMDVECGVDETCINGDCIFVCDENADCDDMNACTMDVCSAGSCSHALLDCDDELACTDDSCDMEMGCLNLSNCAADEVCDPSSGACLFIDLCTTDSDCPDDGLFCNGEEHCDAESDLCVHSGDPCASDDPCAPRVCNEERDLCQHCPLDLICDPFPGLTLGPDDFAGGQCDNTFSAGLAFFPPTGTNRPTLETGDSVDGREGNDALHATFNFTSPTTVSPTLTSIETVTLGDFGTAVTTLDGTGISGTLQYNFLASTNTNAFVVSNLTSLANLGIRRQGVGATLIFTPAATMGSNDALTLTLDGMTGGTVTFGTDPANGIETVNIVSTSHASVLTALSVGGPPLNSLNVSGDAALTLTNAVTANVINASAFAGALTMSTTSIGTTSVIGGGGNDTLYGTTGADTLSGGLGDDTFFGQGGADIITTGSGSDVLTLVVTDVGDIITDVVTGTDKIDWNTALSSIDGSVTTPAAATSFQSAAAGTAIHATTTVFELASTTVSSQTAAGVVTALGATAINADANANLLFIIYTTGGGAAIWNWINVDADVEAAELMLVATLGGVTADSLVADDFR